MTLGTETRGKNPGKESIPTRKRDPTGISDVAPGTIPKVLVRPAKLDRFRSEELPLAVMDEGARNELSSASFAQSTLCYSKSTQPSRFAVAN